MEFYSEVEKFVTQAFTNAKNVGDLRHFERTVYWLKQLKPDADEALCIAAFAHDTERAFRSIDTNNKITQSQKGFTDQVHLKHHQETGAKIIGDYLTSLRAPEVLVKKVERLISRHEVGGQEDENLLKDADSISYFENQINLFLSKKVAEVGKEKVKLKFEWMFERMSSEKAKEIAKPMYEKAIKELGI